MNCISVTISCAVILSLSALMGVADDVRDTNPKVDELRDRVEYLEGRLERLKDILRVQGLLPPDNFDDPSEWTVVRIKIDGQAVIWKDGEIQDITSMANLFKAIYKNGKFPDLKISQHPDAPEDKVAEIYVALFKAGAPTISFEGWTE